MAAWLLLRLLSSCRAACEPAGQALEPPPPAARAKDAPLLLLPLPIPTPLLAVLALLPLDPARRLAVRCCCCT